MLTSQEYLHLFKTCEITNDPKKKSELDQVCKIALANKGTYQVAQFGTKSVCGANVPWPLIAAIHFRESNQNFKTHLCNGDPLLERTVRVPAGRPKTGMPPFTWSHSAIDTLSNVWHPRQWDIVSCMEFLERYNGLGYQKLGRMKSEVYTPYLWDWTNHYRTGLFTSDGQFDLSVQENRPGCMAFLKTLEQKGVNLDFHSLGTLGTGIH